MPVVYVMDPQVRLRRESGRLLVEKKQQLLAQIPLFRLESVFVYGNIQLSMPLLAQLLREGIAVAFFSKYGRFRGRLVGPLDRAQVCARPSFAPFPMPLSACRQEANWSSPRLKTSAPFCSMPHGTTTN